ncbi:MAG: imidazole glycerol phosphate synthase subunit HisH [Alphaproteobacteria bacterium]|nr:imidazole glycerol phosphate synthase subunit HisH [Alphaproteobacteria bacterium]
MLAVLDYGGGNLKSIVNRLEAFGIDHAVTGKAEDILRADRIVFPGQGHFGQVMQSLTFKGLAEPLIARIKQGIPFLGICVGLQVLFDESEEAPGVRGLGLLKGKIVRFTQGKIPQIGWNKINVTAANSFLQEDYFYFVNSYHAVCDNPSVISATAEYHIPFTAAVETGNIAATQFHPEKSGQAGYDALLRWIMKS